MFVGLYFRAHFSETTLPKFTTFSLRVSYGHGSVLLWRSCDTLCTSGSADDVMFANDRPGNGDRK